MSIYSNNFWFGLVLCFLVTGCAPKLFRPETVQFNKYQVNGEYNIDSSLMKMLQPFHDSLSVSMDMVIGENGQLLENDFPEASLGFMVTDAMVQGCQKKMGLKPDVACINSGGVRIPQLSSGKITVGKVYEIMPFDNILIMIKLKGAATMEFFDFMAAKGGWPLSGATYTVDKNKAIDILIGGKPINAENDYTIAINDFVANGGGDCKLFFGIPQISNGYLIRDAIIDYVKGLTAEGKVLQVEGLNRVTRTK